MEFRKNTEDANNQSTYDAPLINKQRKKGNEFEKILGTRNIVYIS